ncbi:MAG TPA: ABC transporter permease [Geminicoccaceae bacterium]|nr:ABC transporter permease [Geminicoccus sp.]HMU48749.1 ABC transporter permease [Geminicoccaceae bacterium]
MSSIARPAATAIRAKPTRARRWLGRSGSALMTLAGFLVIWEGLVRIFQIKSYLVPPPSMVAMELVTRFPRILDSTGITTLEIAAGFAVAVAAAIPLALAVAFSPWVERNIYPAIVTFTIIPKIAIAPLFIIWFGFGLAPKILLVFLLSFFPMLVNNIAGFRSVSSEILDFARSTGAGPWRLFVKIRLPASLPYMFTGMKIGATNAVTAAVVAEFVASNKGLGYLLLEYNGDLETAAVFATVAVLSVFGLALYYLVELAERVAIPWHVSQRSDGVAARST